MPTFVGMTRRRRRRVEVNAGWYKVAATVITALRAYAIVLGKQELRLVEPLPQLVAFYCSPAPIAGSPRATSADRARDQWRYWPWDAPWLPGIDTGRSAARPAVH